MENNGVNDDICTHRAAGILMHITSLPGSAYIGDIGNAAKSFASFLHRSHQMYWQLLPLQPVNSGQGYSPYASYSAMACNPLLISLESLAAEGLLDPEHLHAPSYAPSENTNGPVDYERAMTYKTEMLDTAFRRWNETAGDEDRTFFDAFCAREAYWLDDFALYACFRKLNNNAPWYEWPRPQRDREPGEIQKTVASNRDLINRIRWEQMMFDKQWKELRLHCDSLQVRLIGDVPIYVAHDSADAWSHRDIFTIAEGGVLSEIAGVPPDFFNDEGQLWGMPLFDWDRLKSRKYDWWVQRIRRNLEYFDYIRLDHFRGFAAYWAVPAGSATAKTGTWKPGPGLELFKALRASLGRLPFIAEDLGEIDEEVYALRDDAGLPGMNVLQFAFGEDMPRSPYLPHHHIRNSVVYTGTHDNNTTTGWFGELDTRSRKNVSEYLGKKINEKNISHLLCRLAYMSVSNLVILPMQDILALDGSARMNMPASPQGNWEWRMEEAELSLNVENTLNTWCYYFNRKRGAE